MCKYLLNTTDHRRDVCKSVLGIVVGCQRDYSENVCWALWWGVRGMTVKTCEHLLKTTGLGDLCWCACTACFDGVIEGNHTSWHKERLKIL